MSILKTSESVRNKQILVTESSLDLNNIEKINEKDLELRYKTYTKGSKNDILIAPCKTATAKGKSYIIGRDL
ncbi:TPA: hypothetical protein DEP21_03955 [Patescibacteria group bacterium]|nr:hypothetical protein [Candidatus Gracilibacteria bacterium]